MKKKGLYLGIVICVVAVIAIYSVSLCRDDKDFRVVEIGEIDGVPISGPMKWAPSGDKIAYAYQSKLVAVDTLGHKILSIGSELSLHRFEWLSEKEIVAFEQLRSRQIEHIRLVRYDITTGESAVIEEFQKNWPLPRGLNEGYFEGPYLTVQGNLYYYIYAAGVKVPTFPESKYQEKSPYESNYIYRLTPGGLYLIRADLKDSIYAYDKGYVDTVQSLKQKYYVSGGFVTNLKDSSSILLDTFPVLRNAKQSYLGCGFMNEEINPKRNEVIFYYTCDIDQHNTTGYLYLMDLDLNKFIELAQEVNEDYCQVARFSPDGQKIAMCCTGKGYIIIREE